MKFTPVSGALVLLLSSAASRADSGASSLERLLLLQDVEIRSGASADISVSVFANERSSRCSARGRSILALAGIGFTAASWRPTAEAVFAEGATYCRFYAIDPPGHGNSGLPHGMLFGDMTLNDLLTAYRNTWTRLTELNVRPDTVVGHSQGALLTQQLQDQLLQEGSSLREEFGARDAVLLGASPPAAIEWSAATPELFSLLSSFITSTPERGTFAEAPPEAWAQISYTNFAGVPHPDTPIADLPRYTSPESIPSVLELFGFAGFSRPEVRRGVFARRNGTRLSMVAFSQDPFGLIPEQEELYEYLTDDCRLERLAVVEDEFAVHNLHNAQPELIIEALANLDRATTLRQCPDRVR
jgi:pimeloyl-ACP methyl ester carboxylesterase